LIGWKKNIILVSKLKKVEKRTYLFKNFSLNSFLKVSKIIKLVNLRTNMKKFIGIITGRNEITSFWTLLEFFSKVNIRTQIRFIVGNTFPENFPFLKELKNFELNFPNIKIFYCLEKPFKTSEFDERIINKHQIQELIGKPDIGKSILVCGPLKMNLLVFKILHLIGFSKESIVKI